MIITIDGPTGSGKSTAARGLAERLNFYCLSSGFLYRALAYILLKHFGYTKEDLYKASKNDIQQALDPKKFKYEMSTKNCGLVIFSKENITSFLKSEEVSQGASIIAINKFVRQKLTDLQRELAKNKNFILEGRDSGSVVFNDADVKFYLTAELGERAKRWQNLQKMRGEEISFEEAKKQVKERDTRDQEREVSPLIIPEHAIIIDNTYLTQTETVDNMISSIKKQSTSF
jgi:cytidylate kinase